MTPHRRVVYGLLSSRSLSYADACLRSLFRAAIEPLSLTLITDSPADKAALTQALELIAPDPRHTWRVADEAEADARAEVVFARYPSIRRFRKGHPCWRKITDPSLFAREGEEMINLDPDVYFPNPFRFEPTPERGVLLMWQRPNCLFPPDVVRRAFDLSIPMADHVDIGVCQATAPLDLPWLEAVIDKIGGGGLPAWSMHVEPIIWAAMAMEFGGGYLDPKAWYCWDNTLAKRLRIRLLKADSLAILRSDPFAHMKCFHAGGLAKNWLVRAEQAGLFSGGESQDRDTPVLPYVEYPRSKFDRKQRTRGVARSIGLLRLLGSHQ